MTDSNLYFRTRVFTIHMIQTIFKGVSNLQLHRDLGISKLGVARRPPDPGIDGDRSCTDRMAVEVDETLIGGSDRVKHLDKKLQAGGAIAGKAAVADTKDR